MTRPRARAIAIARRRPDPLPWLPWLLLLSLLLLGMMAIQSAHAQTTPLPGGGTPLVTPSEIPPGQAATPAPTPDTPGGRTQNGVATPSVNRDPGIVRAVPVPATSMPVIRPPGTPGGDTSVVPK